MLEQSKKEFHDKTSSFENEQDENVNWEETTEKKGVVAEDDYKSLQSEYTKTNQDRINAYVELAKRDKSYIESIKDKKIQDKVINTLYSLSSLEEAKAIYWDGFLQKADEGEESSEEEDRTEKLERELKLMKWQQGKKDLEAEMNKLREKHKNLLFDEDLEKVREELKWISDELPLEERVKRAWSLVLNNKYTSEDLAYKMLKEKWGVGWSGVSEKSFKETDNKDNPIDLMFQSALRNKKK